jgi:hypothetical protein
MDFLSHLHVVVKHIVKLTRANNNMQMAQKRREKQTVLIQRTSLRDAKVKSVSTIEVEAVYTARSIGHTQE